MNVLAAIREFGHEQVIVGQDRSCGYMGIIAIHSSVLGTAVGGTRLWSYENEMDALRDVLRLSRGMTHKNAIHRLPLGGGKSVIVAGSHERDREAVFRAHGRLIGSLHGRYITAEDVGTTPDDMAMIRKETEHVVGLPGAGGDPSPWTARGVLRAIQAAATRRWGDSDLRNRTVLIQGCGAVGYHLGRLLHGLGARMLVSDLVASRAARLADEFGASVRPCDSLHRERGDIFAPCALGAVLNDVSIPALQVEIVAGGANNQLDDPRHDTMLAVRGITYVPDYVANGGGVVSGYHFDLRNGSRAEVESAVDGIFQTTTRVLELAERLGLPTGQAADWLVRRRLDAAPDLENTPGTAAPRGSSGSSSLSGVGPVTV